MMNITRNQIAGIQEFFDGNDIQNNAFYPLISARVMRVNGVSPIRKAVWTMKIRAA